MRRLTPLVPTGWTSLVSLEADRGDGLQVIPYGVGCVPCGLIAGPLVQDSRVCGCQVSAARAYVLYIPGAWVRGLPRTCQRDGVHVIPCGVGCRLYLAGSPGARIRKAPMEEGVAALSAHFQSRCSCWHTRTAKSFFGLVRTSPLRPPQHHRSTDALGRVGSRVHIDRVVSGECRSGKRPPHTPASFPAA